MPGRKYSYEVNRTSTAPPSALFALEADGPRWAEWGKPLIVQARWARQGTDEPIKDYRAEVLFTPTADGGTHLRWTGSFTEPVRGSGPLLAAGLRATIRVFSAKLVKAAETGR